MDSFKNNNANDLLDFDNLGEKIFMSKPIFDFATARRHPGLNTTYNRQNLFHQSKLRRDFQLQNTHTALINSLRDVMQVTTLGPHLGFGLGLVGWYREVKFVAYGHFLIILSPRTDDGLRYCTNNGSIPSKLSFRERLKH